MDCFLQCIKKWFFKPPAGWVIDTFDCNGPHSRYKFEIVTNDGPDATYDIIIINGDDTICFKNLSVDRMVRIKTDLLRAGHTPNG